MTPIKAISTSILFQFFAIISSTAILRLISVIQPLPTKWDPLFIIGIATAIIATTLSVIFIGKRVWSLFNFFVPIMIVLLFLPNGLSNINSIFGGIIAIYLAIYLPTFWTHVPFYPTSLQMYSTILEQLPRQSKFCFLDIGSGFGSLLCFLERNCPNASFHGVEISPLPYFVSRIRTIFRPRIRFIWQDFNKINFSNYQFVYAFLAPGPMPKLWEKVRQEVPKGGVFLVNTFKIDAPMLKSIEIQDSRNCVLYVYQI